MHLETLDATSITDWLGQRVNYIISENALSTLNLLFKRVIYVAEENVDYPNFDIAPYSVGEAIAQKESDSEESGSAVGNAAESEVVMTNLGAAIYQAGKEERQIYGMKISRGLLHKSEKVLITSPRAGIIQIGEGLFSPELTVNQENKNSLANSIFRIGTFFHEARHSDGHGSSLAFIHAVCPPKHDYEGELACDESLNGPYTIGALMMAEMAKSCDDSCSTRDKETLKLIILDSANRVLTTTHKGEPAVNWDPRPESVN